MDDDEGLPYSWAWKEPIAEDEPGPTEANYVAKPGKGFVTYPNGDTYEGDFNNAKAKHGKGIYTWNSTPGANPWAPEPDEDEPPSEIVVRYEGSYQEGKRHGIGKMTFPNGERYHGNWVNNKFEGQGTYFYKNGDIYSGNWKDGVKSGEGTFLFKNDESQLVGTWEKGHMITGKWIWKDGTVWAGPFKNSKPVGKGVYYFPNGTMQDGEYVPEENPDEEAPMQLIWKGGEVRDVNISAADVNRVYRP